MKNENKLKLSFSLFLISYLMKTSFDFFITENVHICSLSSGGFYIEWLSYFLILKKLAATICELKKYFTFSIVCRIKKTGFL